MSQDIESHERLISLNIVLTRAPNAEGLYTATVCPPIAAALERLRTENKQLTDNITSVQARCTELLGDARAWRAKWVEADKSARYLRRILEELAVEAGLPVDDLPGITRAFRGRDGAHQRAKAFEVVAKAGRKLREAIRARENVEGEDYCVEAQLADDAVKDALAEFDQEVGP